MNYAKSISITPKVITIKLDRNTHRTEVQSEKEANALYALTGGYNQVARSVDIGKFKKLQEQFDATVDELADLL